jgi:chorismate-pyruvate lyase
MDYVLRTRYKTVVHSNIQSEQNHKEVEDERNWRDLLQTTIRPTGHKMFQQNSSTRQNMRVKYLNRNSV